MIQLPPRTYGIEKMIKMRKLTTHSSFYDYAAAMNTREEFKTSGSLRSETGLRGTWSPGRLPREHHSSLGRADYVIFSYSTPIAWHDVLDGWTVPDESYSVTTTRHQNKIRTAVSVLER